MKSGDAFGAKREELVDTLPSMTTDEVERLRRAALSLTYLTDLITNHAMMDPTDEDYFQIGLGPDVSLSVMMMLRTIFNVASAEMDWDAAFTVRSDEETIGMLMDSMPLVWDCAAATAGRDLRLSWRDIDFIKRAVVRSEDLLYRNSRIAEVTHYRPSDVSRRESHGWPVVDGDDYPDLFAYTILEWPPAPPPVPVVALLSDDPDDPR